MEQQEIPIVSANQRPDHDSSLKLSNLDMFRFDSNKLTWQRFWTHFDSAINFQRNLPESQKFPYLIPVIDGKAAALIEGLQHTDKGYQAAVKLLKEEFDNENVKQTNMNALTKLKELFVRLAGLHC